MEDEALFGDLFSEGGRSVGSVDGYDQSVIAASSATNINMPLHAAAELFIFQKTCAFSPEWNSSIYEDARKKLTIYHIDILLSVLSCQGCYAGDRTSDVGDRKYVHALEVCYELLHNLILFNALSESLEDYLVCKIYEELNEAGDVETIPVHRVEVRQKDLLPVIDSYRAVHPSWTDGRVFAAGRYSASSSNVGSSDEKFPQCSPVSRGGTTSCSTILVPV